MTESHYVLQHRFGEVWKGMYAPGKLPPYIVAVKTAIDNPRNPGVAENELLNEVSVDQWHADPCVMGIRVCLRYSFLLPPAHVPHTP